MDGVKSTEVRVGFKGVRPVCSKLRSPRRPFDGVINTLFDSFGVRDRLNGPVWLPVNDVLVLIMEESFKDNDLEEDC